MDSVSEKWVRGVGGRSVISTLRRDGDCERHLILQRLYELLVSCETTSSPEE
jgi:hypothetical protein